VEDGATAVGRKEHLSDSATTARTKSFSSTRPKKGDFRKGTIEDPQGERNGKGCTSSKPAQERLIFFQGASEAKGDTAHKKRRSRQKKRAEEGGKLTNGVARGRKVSH